MDLTRTERTKETGALPAVASELDAAAPGAADALYVGFIAAGLALLAFVYFFSRGTTLLYGDATAHIHIARRVFDSRTPGLSQLGTVWLPLPHMLMIPFIMSIWLWRTGVGGSIPSMIAFVAGTVGVFRLVRSAGEGSERPSAARVAAWCAALAYALNPNLLYLQATAMTEPLYLALFVWVVVYFTEFVQATRATGDAAQWRRNRSLTRCGVLLFAAVLTRYDGWFAAAGFGLAAFVVVWRWTAGRIALWRSPLRPVFVKFVLLLAIAPLLWFAYNAWNWGSPLEFATGPYSARAIEARAERPGGWHYPGWHAPRTAITYFVKAAKLNLAGGVPQRETEGAPRWRLENLWVPLALAGTVLLLAFARGLWPWLMLWLPLPFYALSIAWGGVPIFLPVWWPYSYYNVRYGLQLAPALIVFAAALVYLIGARWRKWQAVAAAALPFAVLTGASYAVAWRATPICLREARENNKTRVPFDRALATELQKLPTGATVLMYTASHAAALEFAGFPLRRTVNETNAKMWPASLAAPGTQTDFVIAFETPDDPVWKAVQEHADELQVLSVVEGWKEPRAFVYARKPAKAAPVMEAPTAPLPSPATASEDKDKKAADVSETSGVAGRHTTRRRHHRRRR